jgi:hypothetical protein
MRLFYVSAHNLQEIKKYYLLETTMKCNKRQWTTKIGVLIIHSDMWEDSEVDIRLLLLLHWHYNPLWVLAYRTISLHCFLSVTNSLHLLTPST